MIRRHPDVSANLLRVLAGRPADVTIEDLKWALASLLTGTSPKLVLATILHYFTGRFSRGG